MLPFANETISEGNMKITFRKEKEYAITFIKISGCRDLNLIVRIIPKSDI